MKKNVTIFLILIFFYFDQINAFPNLSQAVEYANIVHEFPEPGNKNWADPDYSNLHDSMKGSTFSRFLEFVGYKKNSWVISDFEQALRKVVDNRELFGHKPGSLIKITANPNTKFIIFGQLQGSFHSLVRDLQSLKQNGIINENLQIIDKSCYIVFNGNVILNGPYILETFTLILNLMENNPQAVIYVAGKAEYQGQWLDTALKKELKTRIRIAKREKIPQERLIKRFFDTLPLAVYITEPKSAREYIRISYYGRNFADIDETKFSELNKDDAAGTIKIFYPDKYKGKINFKVKAVVRADDRISAVLGGIGLYLLEAEKGSTTWATLSSPNVSNQHLYEFFYDAYVVLTIQSPIQSSTLSLYNEDVRDLKGLTLVSVFNIESGQKIIENKLKLKEEEDTTKIKPAEIPKKTIALIDLQNTSTVLPVKKDILAPDANEIVLGSTLDLTKGVPVMGNNVKNGLSLKANRINQEGGIKNKLIKIVFEDDGYTPSVARENIMKFINEYKTNLIIGTVGTPTMEASLDLVRDKRILVMFPVTGASIFRKPDLKYMINYRLSYADEVEALIKYIESLGLAKKFAFFYQDDAYGLGPLAASKEILKKIGIKDWIEVPYERNNPRLDVAIAKLKESAPDVIGLYATGIASSELIRILGADYFSGKTVFAISFMAEHTFKRFVKDNGVNVIFAHVTPNPETSKLPIVEQYRQEAKKRGYQLDAFALEGYIGMTIFVNAVENIKDKLTADNIINYFEGLKNYDLKGLELNFNPQTRELSKSIWLDIGEPEWIKQDVNNNGVSLTSTSFTITTTTL